MSLVVFPTSNALNELQAIARCYKTDPFLREVVQKILEIEEVKSLYSVLTLEDLKKTLQTGLDEKLITYLNMQRSINSLDSLYDGSFVSHLWEADSTALRHVPLNALFCPTEGAQNQAVQDAFMDDVSFVEMPIKSLKSRSNIDLIASRLGSLYKRKPNLFQKFRKITLESIEDLPIGKIATLSKAEITLNEKRLPNEALMLYTDRELTEDARCLCCIIQ